MQKQLTGYTLDPKGYEIVFNKEAIRVEAGLIQQIGYETLQIFDGESISKYKTIVIVGASQERVDFVKEIYQLHPTEQRSHEGTTHYIFKFAGQLTVLRFNIVGRNLSELYQADYQHHAFLKDDAVDIVEYDMVIQEGAINSVFEYRPIADTVNEPDEIMFNATPIGVIAQKLRYDGGTDPILNIAPGIGEPFNLVVYVLGSIQNAMVWCNKYYDNHFIVEDAEVSKYIVDGVMVRKHGIIESNGGYKMESDKGMTEITDFLIAVHYQLVKADGENVYIVSIVPRKGKKVEHVEWKNVSSDGNLADFLMRMGSFHMGGGKKAVKALHEMITDSKVPIIHTMLQYGATVYKGQNIMICYDGVFDMNTRKMFHKNEKFGFYFIGGNDGIMISTDHEAGKIQKEFIPRITKVGDYKYKDYLAVTGSMYRNSTAHILIMYACSMAGVSLYHKGNKTPSYYVTGVTGTGKSSFAECLYTMFGVQEAYGLRNSTAYPVKTNLSAFNRLPVFFNEFRSDMKAAAEKLGYIQMAYDNSTTSKGLRQGGTISYKMTSQVFCEGEDTYDEGSIRTRSILHTLSKTGTTLNCIPKNVIQENKLMLESFFGTYATNTSSQDYDTALKETRALFYRKGVEPRISDNISILYAGCMAFAPDMKEEFITTCNELVDAQMEDFQENGESQKMLKILAEYYGNKYCNVYIELGYLYIDWTEITMYIDRFKRNMTLSIGAYQGHMEALGFEKNFYEIESKAEEWGELATKSYKIISGFRMPLVDLPKNLLNNQRIFSEYRKARNLLLESPK